MKHALCTLAIFLDVTLIVCFGCSSAVTIDRGKAAQENGRISVQTLTVNETAVVAMLRAICTAQEANHHRQGHYGTLAMLREAKLLDFELYSESEVQKRIPHPGNGSFAGRLWGSPGDTFFTKGYKTGYCFKVCISRDEWKAYAQPQEPRVTGMHSFYVDQTGVVRVMHCKSKDNLPADEKSTPLRQ